MARRSTGIDENSLIKMGAYLSDKQASSVKTKSSKVDMARQFMAMDADLKAHVEKTKVIEGIGSAWHNSTQSYWDESVRVQGTTKSIPAIYNSLLKISGSSLGMAKKHPGLNALMPEIRAMTHTGEMAYRIEQDASRLLMLPNIQIDAYEEVTENVAGVMTSRMKPKIMKGTPYSAESQDKPVSEQRSLTWAMEHIESNSDAAMAVAKSIPNLTERKQTMRNVGWFWDENAPGGGTLRGKQESNKLIAIEDARVEGAAFFAKRDSAALQAAQTAYAGRPEQIDIAYKALLNEEVAKEQTGGLDMLRRPRLTESILNPLLSFLKWMPHIKLSKSL